MDKAHIAIGENITILREKLDNISMFCGSIIFEFQ
jgi:hypothetical protein